MLVAKKLLGKINSSLDALRIKEEELKSQNKKIQQSITTIDIDCENLKSIVISHKNQVKTVLTPLYDNPLPSDFEQYSDVLKEHTLRYDFEQYSEMLYELENGFQNAMLAISVKADRERQRLKDCLDKSLNTLQILQTKISLYDKKLKSLVSTNELTLFITEPNSIFVFERQLNESCLQVNDVTYALPDATQLTTNISRRIHPYILERSFTSAANKSFKTNHHKH